MPPPPPWRFRCYVSADGVDQIRAWYEGQSSEVRRKFLSRLLALRGLPFAEWQLPLFRWLHGDAHGLGEARFKADRVQQRPLGFQGPGEDVFTLVLCANEKGGAFVPRNATELGLRRKAEIENNVIARSQSCWLFDDSGPDIPAPTTRH